MRYHTIPIRNTMGNSTTIKWRLAFAFLWIAGLAIMFIVTEEYYQYNESWNRIRRRGQVPTLSAPDITASQSHDPLFRKIYDQKRLPPYWNPYIFGGMPSVFNGVSHFLTVPLIKLFGGVFHHQHKWFYIIELLLIIFVLWLEFLGPPVTSEEIATNREDQKICKLLLYSIVGWLVFYWFYAEIK